MDHISNQTLLKGGIRDWLFLAMSALAACSGSGHSSPKSQVVAKVNSGEITISQLNQALQTANPETVTPEVTKHAIESLIDEELLVQAALKNKMDRDPETIAAMEDARRQILAHTYAERMLYPKQPVTLSEEEKYYRVNPALFQNRRLYRMTVYTVKQTDMSDVLTADLNNAHSSDQVRDVLVRHQIKFETQQVNSGAEELPLEKLSDFAKANVGDLLIAQESDGKALLISVVDLEDKPLSFERAKPAIEQYLTKTRNSDAIEDHLRAQRAKASISYVGDFSKFRPAPTSAKVIE